MYNSSFLFLGILHILLKIKLRISPVSSLIVWFLSSVTQRARERTLQIEIDKEKVKRVEKDEKREKKERNLQKVKGSLMNWFGMRAECCRDQRKQTGLKHLFTLCFSIKSNGPL